MYKQYTFEAYVPSEFISSTMLRKVVKLVSDDLAYYQHVYQLVHKDIKHYYCLQDIIFYYKDI
jgi:hypothetical protein